MSFLAPVARLCFLFAICCGAAFADTQPGSISFAPESRQDDKPAQLGSVRNPENENLVGQQFASLPSDPRDAEPEVAQSAHQDATPARPASAGDTASPVQPRLADLPPDRMGGGQAILPPARDDGALARLESEGEAASVTPPHPDNLLLNRADGEADPAQLSEPFGLPAKAASAGETTAKWSELQSRIAADLKTIAACRSGNDACTPAARRFLSIVELGRRHQGQARLAWINRAVNLSVRPMSDWAQYGYADYWASPLQTLGSGAGDCEDYAILKYVVLRELGNAPDDLRLVIVRDNARQTDHAVLAVHYEGEWLVLDNRSMVTINAEQDRYYDPMFVMDYRGVRAFSTASR
jgi:predicted transglutaminase-like cysteine proteinase